jgi:hypothetical protein
VLEMEKYHKNNSPEEYYFRFHVVTVAPRGCCTREVVALGEIWRESCEVIGIKPYFLN